MAHLHAPAAPPAVPPNLSERRCAPEILDSLPENSPEAQHCRSDLRRLNALMGNDRWFARTLPKLVQPGERLIELGAGSGELGARLAGEGLPVTGLDLAPRPPAWPAGEAWWQTDLLDFKAWADTPVVLGNLVLHHFEDHELQALGRQFDRDVRVLVVSEPWRRMFSHRLFALGCFLFRAHPITRHDGAVSINAGFRGEELPKLLGLDPRRWRWRIDTTLLGGYRLVAQRQ
jgi:hypothetical protein